MSIFNGKRLTNVTFKLDIERMRRGWYSDKYFENVGNMLATLSKQGYTFQSSSPRGLDGRFKGLPVGDMQVEMQWFTRRKPAALVAGVDKALSMLYHCTGYFDENGEFVETWDQLEVEAVQDGVFVRYEGDPLNVQPVLKVRGVYRHFAMLETPTLGILSRASRIATNVYNTLVAARGKPVLFFPARFDVHEVQAADGYAYDIAVQRYNMDYDRHLRSFVSTDAQGDWWGGPGGGTVPHAVIACFFANTTEAMLCFAATQPPHVPRIALVDFNNDCVGTSLAVAKAMFERYRDLKAAGQDQEAEKFRLFGVRLDTSSDVRDVALEPMGDPTLDLGVNPRLVVAVRKALDRAWESWDLPAAWQEEARNYCRGIRIVVSGGFNPEKIARFERLGVPADIYGVGSSLMANDSKTNTDFTADVVRIKVGDEWVDMAKVGRRACDNPDLEPVPVDYATRKDCCADLE
ncbi:MAG TPA: nicotinate phosphoribosyltransferase [Chloroflexi bacterium]|nr:nicotinate phosphoribosyltransferase [Chloroflexota bacterium]